MKQLGKRLLGFWHDEEGLGTLELLLIVAVLVIVAVAFRKWILAFIRKLFGEANTELDNKGVQDNCFSTPDTCTKLP
ncbi:Flp1 family type IVb pilin [Paenibacillus hodogayensis]|uniref:Flp1 family type IVb pilin n=1 Tax=Paenibacillus hodogayensis TaxID=279208 RepID=A0ABV5W3V9_9BACL